MAKAKKGHARRCDVCGEEDKRFKRVTVRIDGKLVSSWRLCRSCAAIKMVLLGDHYGRKGR